MQRLSARNFSVDGVLDWLVADGLTILLILLTAVLSRWLIHRFINRIVAAMTAPRKPRRGSATDGTTTAAGTDATDATDGTDAGTPAVPPEPDRVATGELPTVRRHARLAARALEGGLLNPERQHQRVETLGSVLRSIATIVILVITVLMVGDQLGLNMAPVLASAGIGGVALGFGAQSLVKDFLSGMFMLAEDQYGVGDVIDVGTASGTVEEVSLRVTRIRDPNGVIWYVRNGEIVSVANKSQGWSTAMVDIPVSALESPEHVIEVLRAAMADLDDDAAWADILMEEPRVAGVESATGGAMTIRILAKCAPNQHWGVQREIRERGLTACAAAGIKPPPSYPSYGGNPA